MPDYRIDDLAREAGTTVRNVRVYQERGLLPAPRRSGRVAIYNDAHLARLKLIGELLDRGYTFNHIAQFIDAWQEGRDLGDVLGLEEALAGPWSDEAAGYFTADELVAMFGDQVTDKSIVRAIRLGVIVPDGDRFRAPSPRLLRAGAELVAAGIPLSAVLDLAAGLGRDIDRVAKRLVETINAHIETPDYSADTAQLADFAALVRRLRPLAEMTIDALLAQAMERRVNAAFGAQLAREVEVGKRSSRRRARRSSRRSA